MCGCARCRSRSRCADAFTGTHRRIAYERLLLDLIEGAQTLFVRRDEVEAQWRWIDQVRATWAQEGMAPRPYTAGSWGPVPRRLRWPSATGLRGMSESPPHHRPGDRAHRREVEAVALRLSRH